MARSVTIATLLTRCKDRVGLANDLHISDAEWQVLIAALLNELAMAVNDSGMRYYETTATIVATGATYYALPAGHLGTVAVYYVADSAGRRIPLTEIMVQEAQDYVGLTGTPAGFYALAGANIELYPTPASGSYAHVYIPQPTDYATIITSTTVDVVTPDGEEFVIEGVACKALPKSEADRSTHLDDRDAAKQRLIDWAIKRSTNTPRRLVNQSIRRYRVGDWRYGR